MPARNPADTLAEAVKHMGRDYRAGRFVPLLEDDIVAYLYHRLLASGRLSADRVHVKTRVKGLQGKKVDLAVGRVAAVGRGSGGRRQVDAELAVEVKFLNEDTNYGERANFRRNVMKDIARLRKLARAASAAACAVVVADETGHLYDERRRESLEDLRTTAESSGIKFCPADLRLTPVVRAHPPERGRPVTSKVFVRTYKGKEYHLRQVGPRQFVLDNGREYGSLTAAAKAVTGYEYVSGPAWWGRPRR